MITTFLKRTDYQTQFTNGNYVSASDTTADKGGSGQGFRPHELLEAALANCMNITIRMFASEHSIPLSSISTIVTLDRNSSDEACFNYNIKLPDNLSEEDKQTLLRAVKSCPVRNTLLKKIKFKEYDKDYFSIDKQNKNEKFKGE